VKENIEDFSCVVADIMLSVLYSCFRSETSEAILGIDLVAMTVEIREM
jgi:hypothetical protein